MTAALELQGITKSYDTVQVLQKINLTVEEGEFICLLGPSGCGKTTLLRIIAGLLDPTDGDIVIRGRKVTALSPSERNIAMVFQSYALYPHKTVWENIAFPLRMRAPASTKIPFLGRFLPAGKKLTAELSRQVPQAAAMVGLQKTPRTPPLGTLWRPKAACCACPRSRTRSIVIFDGRTALKSRCKTPNGYTARNCGTPQGHEARLYLCHA